MGFIFSKYSSLGKEQKNILMVGLDNAGKTTILYMLQLAEVKINCIQIGVENEIVKKNNLTITATDIGGAERQSVRLANQVYQNQDGIIFVIDISENDRFDIVYDEFMELMANKSFSNIPVLIMLNKIDKVESPSQFVELMVKELKLHKLQRQWQIKICCGIKNQGLHEGLQWILQASKTNQNEIQKKL